MQFDIEIYDKESLGRISKNQFRRDLKAVFDGSIPWDSPSYDDSFQDHYLQHAEAAVVARKDGAPVALSVAFASTLEELKVFYIAGIWVVQKFKSNGLGGLVTDLLIRCGADGFFESDPGSAFIALRTQNPQVYEYFYHRYNVSPCWKGAPCENVKKVAEHIKEMYCVGKDYDAEKMIVRKVFPKGIVVGHLHPAKSQEITEYVYRDLDVRAGDSLILVMPAKADKEGNNDGKH